MVDRSSTTVSPLRVSVITAAYNNVRTIRDTLESVRDQVDVDLEHIIVDGGSRDGTLEVVREFPHVAQVVSEPDRGIYDALNKGMRLAQGGIIGFLHSDDVFEGRHVLRDVVAQFSDPDVFVVYGDLVYVGSHQPNRIIRRWCSGDFSPSAMRRGWMPPHPTVYVRSSVYERVGEFDESFRIAADYDMMVRIFKKEHGEVRYLPQTLVRMRMGGASNKSLSAIWLKMKEDLCVVRRQSLGGLGVVASKNLRKLSQWVF